MRSPSSTPSPLAMLDARSPSTTENHLRAFRQGLTEPGYVEGENVERPQAIFVGNDAYFYTRRVQLSHLATRHTIAAIYSQRDFTEAGGLMSYGSNIADAFRQIGAYAGRILKGAKPANLPV